MEYYFNPYCPTFPDQNNGMYMSYPMVREEPLIWPNNEDTNNGMYTSHPMVREEPLIWPSAVPFESAPPPGESAAESSPEMSAAEEVNDEGTNNGMYTSYPMVREEPSIWPSAVPFESAPPGESAAESSPEMFAAEEADDEGTEPPFVPFVPPSSEVASSDTNWSVPYLYSETHMAVEKAIKDCQNAIKAIENAVPRTIEVDQTRSAEQGDRSEVSILDSAATADGNQVNEPPQICLCGNHDCILDMLSRGVTAGHLESMFMGASRNYLDRSDQTQATDKTNPWVGAPVTGTGEQRYNNMPEVTNNGAPPNPYCDASGAALSAAPVANMLPTGTVEAEYNYNGFDSNASFSFGSDSNASFGFTSLPPAFPSNAGLSSNNASFTRNASLGSNTSLLPDASALNDGDVDSNASFSFGSDSNASFSFTSLPPAFSSNTGLSSNTSLLPDASALNDGNVNSVNSNASLLADATDYTTSTDKHAFQNDAAQANEPNTAAGPSGIYVFHDSLNLTATPLPAREPCFRAFVPLANLKPVEPRSGTFVPPEDPSPTERRRLLRPHRPRRGKEVNYIKNLMEFVNQLTIGDESPEALTWTAPLVIPSSSSASKPPKLRVFACTHEGCDKTFLNAGNLVTHMKVHIRIDEHGSIQAGERSHGTLGETESGSENKGPRYICHICDWGFEQKHCYVHHMRRHDEHSIRCDFGECQQTYANVMNLRQHHNHVHKEELKVLIDILSEATEVPEYLHDVIKYLKYYYISERVICGSRPYIAPP